MSTSRHVEHGLAAFVPADVRAAIACDENPRAVRQGSVLEADVTGFTPLTEALARRHGARRGAEEVAAMLDRVYSALIEEVDDTGGSVVEFSGDAITCCFDEDDGTAALACGLAMQQAMALMQLEHESTPAIRVSVASGSFHRFSAGDPDVRLLEVLAGPAVARLVAIAPSAGGGEVVADAATARRLGALIRAGEQRGSGAASCVVVTDVIGVREGLAREPLPLSNAAARPWLPRAVFDRLHGGGDALLGELRSVVVLFVRFGEIGDADALKRTLFEAYVRFAHDTLAELGGTLFNLAVDAKGCYLCAGFGAPVAHDDDPARAATAALALRVSPPQAAGLAPPCIGIAGGRLYAGTYGGRSRRTFGLQGSTANLAARLMQRADPGQILVEETLAQRLDGRFELRALGELSVKGRDGHVTVRELAGRALTRPPAVAAPTLVDRVHERGRLDAIVKSLLGGDGGVVMLEGEPGIGKSRLLGELIERASARGVRVLLGAGDPIERGAPYHGWRPVFAGTLDIDALLESETTAELTGEARAQVTRDRLDATLGRLARAVPTLVVLEDAHWLDSASLALALRLASTPSPLLLVLSTRPVAESARPELERIAALQRCVRLTLGRLPAADALELAASAVGMRLPEGAAKLVEQKAGGNPLFARELALALRDHGLLDRVLGAAGETRRAAAIVAFESPDSVEAVIAGRIDRLPSRTQTVLKVASVLGLSFSQAALRELVGAAVEEEVRLLERLELLTPTTDAEVDALMFRHALIQEVVYERLLHASRVELHRRTAEYLDGPEGEGATFAARAHHWDRAGVPERAAQCHGEAGEQARRAGAGRECVDALERALELTAAEGPTARRAHWHFCIAQACYWTGEIQRSLAAGASAVAALDRAVPTHNARVAVALAGEVADQFLTRMLGRRRHALAQDDRRRLQAAIETVLAVAEVSYHGGDPLRSLYFSLRSLNLAERLGPSGELALCYGAMCIISGVVGSHRLGERYAALALDTADAAGEPYATALTKQQVAWYRVMKGPEASFTPLFDEAIDGFERLGHKPRQRDALASAGAGHLLFGRHADATLRFHELLTTLEPQEVSLWARWTPHFLGSIALRCGELDGALTRLRRAELLARGDSNDSIAFSMHAVLGLALWRAGRDADAARHERLARACAKRLGRRASFHGDLDARAALAELALGPLRRGVFDCGATSGPAPRPRSSVDAEALRERVRHRRPHAAPVRRRAPDACGPARPRAAIVAAQPHLRRAVRHALRAGARARGARRPSAAGLGGARAPPSRRDRCARRGRGSTVDAGGRAAGR